MDEKIEEMAEGIESELKVYFGAGDVVAPEDFPYQARGIAEHLIQKGYRKIPEGAVVLTRAHEDKIFNDYVEYIKKVRKETAEKFKALLEGTVPQGLLDTIAKEITEGKV